jgi:hypothetical protein
MRRGLRLVRAWPATWLLVAALALGTAPAALGLTDSRSFTAAGEHTFVVPAGVTSVQALLVGGNGGAGLGGGPGGIPATATASLPVTPGQTLYAEVAGDGQTATTTSGGLGGTGGGAAGGDVQSLFGGIADAGGGGGASDVRTCSLAASGCQSLSSRLLVAAGGGGGGGFGGDGMIAIPGGAGGPADIRGFNGVGDGFPSDFVGPGGGRGTASAGGASGGGGALGAGSLGVGGDGLPVALFTPGGGGGGGGGGIFGGGGGSASVGHQGSSGCCFPSGGGGGGGSSGVPAGANGVSNFSLVPTADGAEPQVTFTWTAPAPAVTTGAVSHITTTSASLTGTINPNGSQVTACHFAVSPAPPAGATVPCVQPVGGASSPVPVSATASGLSPATKYVVTLLAASAAGQKSGTAIAFTTLAQRQGQGQGTVPAITKLSMARTVHRKVAKHKHPPVTISLRLSAQASLSFTFARPLIGRRSHHRCVRTKTPAPPALRCVLRYVPVRGALTVTGVSGVNAVRFSGVLDKRQRLALGAYRLTVVAISSAGTSRPQHATFTLVK